MIELFSIVVSSIFDSEFDKANAVSEHVLLINLVEIKLKEVSFESCEDIIESATFSATIVSFKNCIVELGANISDLPAA